MKITISKIDAAKSQLIEAINLFFEERDPVSIHTLLGASLGILHDHITDKGVVWDNNLMFHRETIYIKDEFRKLWQDSIRKEQNFFKHADRDLKNGTTNIEFDPEINIFHIVEAIKALGAIETEKKFWPVEFKVFFSWLVCKYPNMVKDEGQTLVKTAQKVSLKTKTDYKTAIDFMKQHPEKFVSYNDGA
tara:strand:+ start:255610 stop:256179 length:570 start_codon:yes stop_codon:yes gene_type:complete